MQKIITINGDHIANWDSFHGVFQQIFGFPDFYGRNMNAWIDCMTSIDDKDAGMTNVSIRGADTLVIKITNSESLKQRCGEIYFELLECAAFVNSRKLDQAEHAVIVVALA